MTTTYRYSALTADGRTVTGKTKGTSIHSVASTLVDQGLEVQGVRAKRNLAKLEITPYKADRADVMHFSRQLSAFIKAGVPIADAIDMLQGEMKDKVLRGVLTDMGESLRRGDSLAAAIGPHSDVFPPFYVSVLRSVELTGQLDIVLDQLSQYIERDLEARRKIKSALAYPVMVMGLSLMTVGIMAGFVLPRFATFFESFDAELPLPTRILLGFTGFFTAWWWAMALAVFGFVFVMLTFGRTPRGRKLKHWVALRIPMVGVVVRYAVIERFCRILCSMVKAGVPLPDALRLASDGSNNAIFEEGINKAREEMIQGKGLSQPIADTNLFPAAVTQMLAVGENTGTLDGQLESMASYYEKELEYKLKALTTMFEPMTILFMAGVVGFVAVALVSAMYGVFGQVEV
ncbi:MAG: type II secretion system F family protein [Acidimicrobiales bacterium]|nr:type II secretion system F family protein [Acidimicrobiales bacterium]